MKGIKTSSQIIQISEIIQWNENKQLTLSPKYQRNSVWNDKAKSFLIDTIIRGFPIPPIFLRQMVDVKSKTTHREVIDGQQRLRTILEYIVEESITINKSTNPEYAGVIYSNLSEEVQERILSYEILAVLVAEKDDSLIYDMFARLNTNNIVLNRQELRNSKYWGEFKLFVYQMTSEIRDFLIDNIFRDKDLSRMKDSEWVGSLAILMSEGIVDETPKYVDSIYEKYDKEFVDVDYYREAFLKVFEIIKLIFELLNNRVGVFSKKNYLYTLVAVIYHQMYGIKEFSVQRLDIFSESSIFKNINKLSNSIANFLYDWDHYIDGNREADNKELSQFKLHHSSRTTNKPEKVSRITYLSKYLEN